MKMENTGMTASNSNTSCFKMAVVAMVMLYALAPDFAFAQATTDGTGMLCFIAKYFKGIVGAAALAAIMMWGIEHILGASKLHDIVIKVGVAAGLVIVGATIITTSGLTTCSGF